MKKKKQRELVPSKRIKNAYRAFLSTQDTTFISLKDFARNQVETNGSLKDVAEVWLMNKL